MGITAEELIRIEGYGLRAHLAIVDGYVHSGHSVDDLTIRHFVIQPDIALILHAYGFPMGQAYGDEADSQGKYRTLPFEFIEDYVSGFFPGLDRADGETAGLTLEAWLEAYRPGWRNAAPERKSAGILSRWLSKEEELISSKKRYDG